MGLAAVLFVFVVEQLLALSLGWDGVVSPCLGRIYKSYASAVPNTCLQRTSAVLPAAADVLSLLGALAALLMLVLHIRLTRLVRHLPYPDWIRQTDLYRLSSRHVDMVTGSAQQYRLLEARWTSVDARCRSTRSRGLLLAFSAGLSATLYWLYYVHGSMFSKACGDIAGGARGRCVEAVRAGWWANFHSHPLSALGWIVGISIAIYLGIDNFSTTNALTARLRARLALDLANTAPMPFVANLPNVPTSWTCLQGFLTELKLGFGPTILTVLTVYGIADGIRLQGSDSKAEFLLAVAVFVVIVGFLIRLGIYRRALEAGAARSLQPLLVRLQPAGTFSSTVDLEADHLAREHAELLAGQVSLPTVSTSERLRIFFGYLFGLTGLVLAFLQVVQS